MYVLLQIKDAVRMHERNILSKSTDESSNVQFWNIKSPKMSSYLC